MRFCTYCSAGSHGDTVCDWCKTNNLIAQNDQSEKSQLIEVVKELAGALIATTEFVAKTTGDSQEDYDPDHWSDIGWEEDSEKSYKAGSEALTKHKEILKKLGVIE